VKSIDLSGQSFGRLLVLAQIANNKHNQRMWRCWCECGMSVDVSSNGLRKGKTNSCGCLRKDTKPRWKHGHNEGRRKSAELTSYQGAKAAARRYGVEFRFKTVEEFVAAVGHRPRSGYVLSRVDAELDYQPGNLYWRKRLSLTRWQERGYLTLLPSQRGLAREPK
jgi:hypothetical protein